MSFLSFIPFWVKKESFEIGEEVIITNVLNPAFDRFLPCKAIIKSYIGSSVYEVLPLFNFPTATFAVYDNMMRKVYGEDESKFKTFLRGLKKGKSYPVDDF